MCRSVKGSTDFDASFVETLRPIILVEVVVIKRSQMTNGESNLVVWTSQEALFDLNGLLRIVKKQNLLQHSYSSNKSA